MDRSLTRRQFLKEVGAGVAILLFGGCVTNRQPTTIPNDKIILSPTRQPETLIQLPEITKVDIKRIAERCIGDFNRILGFNLPEGTVSKVNLITDLKTYQDILREAETDYQPTDEKDRPGITTDSYHSRGRQVFLYKAAIDEFVKFLPPNEFGIKAREDVLEWFINHELSHWAAHNYISAELHALVYKKMFANIAEFKGKKITPYIVVGAEVKAYVDGIRKSAFQLLEEAEAFVIGDFVTRRRGRPQVGSFPTASDIGVQPQVDLLLDFLRKLGPNLDNTIKTLAKMRREVGGRGEYGRFIGEKFGIAENDQLFFSMSILYAIDRGDRDLYQRLVPSRPTR